MKRREIRLVDSTEGGDGHQQYQTIEIALIKTHPTFVDLLPIDEDLKAKLVQDMRVAAALEAGICEGPFVQGRFESEMATVQRAINLQRQRRTTTDAALYRLCGEFDRLLQRGRKTGDAVELPPPGGNFDGRSASARATAQIIHCNFRKVERIRTIRRDATPEIQEDVSNGRMTISKAYKLIRDMELGTKSPEEKAAAARVKAAKSLFTEENFAAVEELDGDVGDHVNKAIEMYMRCLQDRESV